MSHPQQVNQIEGEVFIDPDHPIDVHVGAVEIKDDVANTRANVTTFAGVNRLRVESIGGGGVAPLNTVTFAAPTFFTAGVASAPAVAANAARKALILVVTTAGRRISLGFGTPAILDSGITVFTGTPVVLDAALLSTQAVEIIANIAGTNVSIQEGS